MKNITLKIPYKFHIQTTNTLATEDEYLITRIPIYIYIFYNYVCWFSNI